MQLHTKESPQNGLTGQKWDQERMAMREEDVGRRTVCWPHVQHHVVGWQPKVHAELTLLL